MGIWRVTIESLGCWLFIGWLLPAGCPRLAISLLHGPVWCFLSSSYRLCNSPLWGPSGLEKINDSERYPLSFASPKLCPYLHKQFLYGTFELSNTNVPLISPGSRLLHTIKETLSCPLCSTDELRTCRNLLGVQKSLTGEWLKQRQWQLGLRSLDGDKDKGCEARTRSLAGEPYTFTFTVQPFSGLTVNTAITQHHSLKQSAEENLTFGSFQTAGLWWRPQMLRTTVIPGAGGEQKKKKLLECLGRRPPAELRANAPPGKDAGRTGLGLNCSFQSNYLPNS